jgi:hypothetical protein
MIPEAEVATKPQNAQRLTHDLRTMTDATLADINDAFVGSQALKARLFAKN